MALSGNQVVPLTITTLTPLHIGTGSRLAANLDYYVDGETTFVVDIDAALDLVIDAWQASREPYEEKLRRYHAELEQEAERIRRADESLRRQIRHFEEHPPRRREEYERQEKRFREEALRLKERKRQLEERRAHPPQPDEEGDLLPPQLIAGSTLDQLIDGGLLPITQVRERAAVNGRALVRYAMRGRPATGDIYEQIKDVADRMYLPGSSLKGAIRSALAWDAAHNLQAATLRLALQGNAKTADDALEKEIFAGSARRRMNDTVRDVLRALHVGDSAPVTVAPDLLTVRIYRSQSATAPIAVEALPEGVELRATLQIERYPFESQVARSVIDFDDWRQRLAPAELAAACRRRAARLIEGELAFFSRQTDAVEVTRFYTGLRQRLEQADRFTFLLPLGWGAGWRAKTLDDRLRDSQERDQVFARLVRRYQLKKHKSEMFKPGDPFPDTRKIIVHGNMPWRPMGWIEVRLHIEA
jgi:CRISPR-associated protein Csm5